jgi:hypothetical protein
MTWNDPANPKSYKAPYGIWKADQRHFWVPQGYVEGDGSLDYGLIEFGPRNGQFIGDVVGSWNITTGIRWKAGARAYLTGYPASGFWATADGYHGRGQYACDARYDNEYSRIGTGYELWLKCTMNGGASGGPWFVLLGNGKWTVGGVNSQCYGPNMGTKDYCKPHSYYLRSAYLDRRFLDFWNSVATKRTW